MSTMKNNKTEKILRLILFLCRQTESTKEIIINSLECDERTFYNYLHDIRAVGFIVKCKAGKYSLVKKNDVYRAFNQILTIDLNEDHRVNEAILRLHLNDQQKKELLVKLAGHLQTPNKLDPPTSALKKSMRRAIRNKKQLIIREHKIPGEFPKSFIAELYSMDNNDEHCWIYIATMNKNVKLRVADIISISISPIQCLFSSKHLHIVNDVFGSYGVNNCETSITITKLGARKLEHLYPASEVVIKHIELSDEYIFCTKLCEYDQIINFILFHPDFIVSINNSQLEDAINEWLSYTHDRFSFTKELSTEASFA